MTESRRLLQQRVQAILLTGRDSVVLVKRRDLSRNGADVPFWNAPGGVVRPDDADEISALRRTLRETLALEIDVLNHAMALFMSQWNFYVCRLRPGENYLWQRVRKNADGGLYAPQEIPLTGSTLRQMNVRPRALREYLLANLVTLRRL